MVLVALLALETILEGPMFPAMEALTERLLAGVLVAAAALLLLLSEAGVEEDALHPPADKGALGTVKTATAVA